MTIFVGLLFWRDIDLVRFLDRLAKFSNRAAKTLTQVRQSTVEQHQDDYENCKQFTYSQTEHASPFLNNPN